jgi:hypothetical protein
MFNRRKILITSAILLLMSAVIGAGTFATFNAQTTNPANNLGNANATMTNVAGTVVSGSNCSTSTSSGTCATLFSTSSTNFVPGAADKTNTVTLTYTGSVTTATFGLYAANYSSKYSGSPAACTASNPASKINLQVKQGGTIVFPTSGSGYGTLDGLATTYTGTGALLHFKGGTNGSGTVDLWAGSDSSLFTINVNLDSSADDTYQGCQSQLDLVWYGAL